MCFIAIVVCLFCHVAHFHDRDSVHGPREHCIQAASACANECVKNPRPFADPLPCGGVELWGWQETEREFEQEDATNGVVNAGF